MFTELAVRENLAARVARALDAAEVHNVLWGWLALSLIHNDRGFPEVEFVIPDNKIQLATDKLVAAGLPLCSHPNCEELLGDRADKFRYPTGDTLNWAALGAHDRYHPVGKAHFHLESLPGPPPVDDVDLMLSNDPSLPARIDGSPRFGTGPSGPWSEFYPVKILSPDSYTESIRWLQCRMPKTTSV
ncbi:hypothetical protein BDW59DRAFT_157330 [Aspergillus cavernicola]|uniref:Uncharacterized protein n=1 Tax=Aspergillus cavernicola TaxID=176166 RepID=A0ABR4IXK4_9EURO